MHDLVYCNKNAGTGLKVPAAWCCWYLLLGDVGTGAAVDAGVYLIMQVSAVLLGSLRLATDSNGVLGRQIQKQA